MHTDKTVREGMVDFLKECKENRSIGTYKTYASRMKQIILNLDSGDKKMRDIKISDIQGVWRNIEEKYPQPSTKRALYDTLAVFLKWCNSKGYIKKIAMEKTIQKPDSVFYKPNLLGEKEAELIMKAAEGTDLYLPIMIGIKTGLKRHQVLELRWQQVDFGKHSICVKKQGKTGSERNITMVPELELTLYQVFLELSKQDTYECVMQKYICKTVTDKRFDPSYFDKKFRRFVEINHLPHGLRFQDLRWSFVNSNAKNMDIKELAESVGHSSCAYIMDYYLNMHNHEGEQSAA